jgi:MinD-like ATPase involved in chromosome partitioning or flagellar assembly
MKPTSAIHFDDSIPRLVGAVRRALGDETLRAGVILRDASGRLSFVAPNAPASEDDRRRAMLSINEALGAYARPDRAIAFVGDPGAGQLLADPLRLPLLVDGIFCQLVDRRIVGAGWLEPPDSSISSPPRFVFASLKGGVGRSTALTVLAADLARRNRNVLVVDLDLEAPGLGALLLDDERMPQFGVIDFLVENGITGVSDAILGDFVGTSALTTGGGGRVDVLPALGRRALANPENILPKLARAMIEDVTEQGDTLSVGNQISTMITRLTNQAEYDAVLIDSRAGLAELAAPAVLGLGATVLLFGTAQKQTIQGYRALFSGLKLLAQRDRAAGGEASWRLMLKPVYAKASLETEVSAQFRDDLYELFADCIYDAEENQDNEGINFDIDDDSAPHWPLVIPFGPNFVDFDSARAPDQLAQSFYEQTFRPFINGIDAIIAASM